MKYQTWIIGLILILGGLWLATTFFSVTLKGPQTITVSGMAQQDLDNEVAQFYAGVQAQNADKDAAMTEVNQKMTEVIEQLKDFGIVEKDIKTQNVSIYQQRDPVTIEGRQTSELGDWYASNNVQIILRDTKNAPDLVALLAQSGLTDVSGPNFMLDESSQVSATLLNEAVTNAREKADQMAEAQGKKVKKVLSITEGANMSPPGVMRDMARSVAGGAAPLQPGTSSQQATVTVVFEIK